MQPALFSPIPDAPLAVFAVNGEKPHQGVASENPALYLKQSVCKSTVLLGMRGQAELNRIGSCCTGKERDTESGNDYFGARYYASSMGRWMSPDWAAKAQPVPYAKLDNPQTLNLYSYVQNNPLSNLDDDGHVTIELRYTPVAVGNHTYIVVTDTNGHQTYYRAGPTNGASSGWITPASSGASSPSSGSNSSNSSNSTAPGAGPGGAGANTGPFGALTAEHGDYVPGTVDYETHPAASVTLLSNDQPAASYTDQLNQYESTINGANIPYNPLSTNSNAYAQGAVQFLGLTPPATPPVLAPGHDTPLPVPPQRHLHRLHRHPAPLLGLVQRRRHTEWRTENESMGNVDGWRYSRVYGSCGSRFGGFI